MKATAARVPAKLCPVVFGAERGQMPQPNRVARSISCSRNHSFVSLQLPGVFESQFSQNTLLQISFPFRSVVPFRVLGFSKFWVGKPVCPGNILLGKLVSRNCTGCIRELSLIARIQYAPLNLSEDCTVPYHARTRKPACGFGRLNYALTPMSLRMALMVREPRFNFQQP